MMIRLLRMFGYGMLLSLLTAHGMNTGRPADDP